MAATTKNGPRPEAGDATETETAAETPAAVTEAAPATPAAVVSSGHHEYVIPVVHTKLPAAAVNIAFWATLATVAVIGAVELPVVAIVGAGVVVARHRNK